MSVAYAALLSKQLRKPKWPLIGRHYLTVEAAFPCWPVSRTMPASKLSCHRSSLAITIPWHCRCSVLLGRGLAAWACGDKNQLGTAIAPCADGWRCWWKLWGQWSNQDMWSSFSCTHPTYIHPFFCKLVGAASGWFTCQESSRRSYSLVIPTFLPPSSMPSAKFGWMKSQRLQTVQSLPKLGCRPSATQ